MIENCKSCSSSGPDILNMLLKKWNSSLDTKEFALCSTCGEPENCFRVEDHIQVYECESCRTR